jgi:hypothetical protein
LDAGGGASVGSGWLAWNGFACSIICPMDSSAFMDAARRFSAKGRKIIKSPNSNRRVFIE